jgi:hypothetical protein
MKQNAEKQPRRSVARERIEHSRALADDMRRHGDGVVRNLRRAAQALGGRDRRAA